MPGWCHTPNWLWQCEELVNLVKDAALWERMDTKRPHHWVSSHLYF